MRVDRSDGATVLLAIIAGVAAAILPALIKANDWVDFLWIESSIVLVSMVLVLARRKTTRDCCAICGSDVETHFLSTANPEPRAARGAITLQDMRSFGGAIQEGPVCRSCTHLDGDRLKHYPWGTKFDDSKNPKRECCRCHRMMRAAFLEGSATVNDYGERLKYSWWCRFPHSKQCEKLAKRVLHDSSEVKALT